MSPCEQLVTQALSHPLVKSMIRGLNDAGCAFDLVRNVVCEPIDGGLAGGYDLEHNQVVLCSNKCQDLDKVSNILAHELVHMYDNCVAKVNWKNINHLACSEIRAAALAHCAGPVSAALHDGAPWSPGHSHTDCVKGKASKSVQAILRCSKVEADVAVDRVFVNCYNDKEPVGHHKCYTYL